MEIKTKFEVDDYPYIIFNSKIYEVKISSISIYVENNGMQFGLTSITYMIDENPAGYQYAKRFNEDELFETKEELTQSLINSSK